MSAIANDSTTLFNSKPPDNDAQRATLARELRVAKGFTLIFALCNSAAERARQISALREELSDLKLQEIPVRTKIPHLLDVLRVILDDPLPDAVFVYGMENWIRSDTNPQSIPFLLNLNAARNHFIEACPCPLVLWIPDYLLRQITTGAPDFVSVRSGLYVFTTSPSEAKEVIDTLQMLGLTESSGMLLDEKQKRLKELEELLIRVQNLPEESRNEQDEVSVLSQLATMYYVMGRYPEAEPLLQEAMEIRRKGLPAGHPDIATSLNNLAALYRRQGRYAEAEPLLQEALEIRQHVLPAGHPSIATSLNNLAALYRGQKRNAEAESLLQKALVIRRQTLPTGHPDIASCLNNLAALYRIQGRYTEAEMLCMEALEINRQALGEEHPAYAASLNNLAALYEAQGRYAEAEPLIIEALTIFERALGPEHPNTQTVYRTLEKFIQERNK